MNRRTFLQLTGATALLTTVPTLFAEKEQKTNIKWTSLDEKLPISPYTIWIKGKEELKESDWVIEGFKCFDKEDEYFVDYIYKQNKDKTYNKIKYYNTVMIRKKLGLVWCYNYEHPEIEELLIEDRS